MSNQMRESLPCLTTPSVPTSLTTDIEAMAARSPVVASDVQGLRDVVIDGTDGLLFRPGDPASMAEAISRVLRGDKVRERLVANARTKASAHDWQTISVRYLDLYRRIVTEMGDDRAG